MQSEFRKTILLVEDMAIIAMAEANTLKKNGFDVVIAYTGNEAIKTASQNPNLDLILMDIDLGKGIDGTEAAQVILKHREVPIVFLSNHTEKDVVEKTEKITSYGYVVKNSGETVLIASIKMAFKLFEAHTLRFESETKLLESDNKFHTLEKQIDDVIWTMDMNFRLTYISPSVEKMYGYTVDEMMNLTLQDYLTHEATNKAIDALSDAISRFINERIDKNIVTLELEQIKKDKSVFPTEIRARFLLDKDNIPSGIIGVTRDITSRKLTEIELRKNQFKISSIFRVAPIGIGVTSNRTLVELNDHIYKMLGYSPEDLIGKSSRVLYPTQAEFEFAGAEKYKQIEQFGTGTVETKWVCKDGRIINVLLSSTPLNLKEISGGVTFTALDITGRKKSEEALRKSQERFTLAQRSANIGSWEWNILTGEVSWSETIEPMFGFKKGEFDGTYEAFLNCVHPEDVALVVEHLNAAINKNEEYKNIEFRIVWPNGTVRWMLENGSVFIDTNEKPNRMIGIVQDITDKKKAEQNIIESERKLSESLKVAKVGYWEYDVLSDNFIFNDQYYSLHNAKAKDIGGYQMTAKYFADNFVYPDDRGLVAKSIFEAINSPNPKFEYQTEARIITLDNKTIWITIWFRLQKDEKGNIIKLIGVNQDINSRKIAEEKLKQSEENYRRFFEEDLSGVFLSTPGGKIKECNQAYVRMMEYDNIEELLNSNPVSHYPESQQRTDFLNLLRREKKLTNYEGKLVTKKGKHIQSLENILGVFDEKDNLVEFWGYVNDITEIKNAEQLLKNAAAEKEALHRELLHRVKNSMALIKALIYIERERLTDPVANKVLEDLEMRIGTLSQMYSMLNVSGISDQVQLHDYIKQITASLTESYIEDSEKIKVNVSCDELSVSPKAASSIGLIVNELLTNSLKYAFPQDKKGSIVVRLTVNPEIATIEVSDNGIGLPKEFSIEQSPGMGTQLVKMLTQQLDGDISIESINGAKVIISFPIDV